MNGLGQQCQSQHENLPLQTRLISLDSRYLHILKDAQGRDEPSPVKEDTSFTAGQITLKKNAH